MNPEKIGKFIAELRKEKKLTQTELAKNICVSNKTVSKWECGNAIPDYGVFENLCKEFDISVTELLAGERNMKDDKIVSEYMKMKGKQNRTKMIIVIVIGFLVLICTVLGIYFINSYNKITMYSLEGKSDNFAYKNGFIVSSNIKNIFQFGDFKIKNKDINEKDILEDFFALEINGKYFKLFDYIGNYLNVEEYGEDLIIPSDKVKYLKDNLYFVVWYMKDGEMILDKTKINTKEVFVNNEFINNKVEKRINNYGGIFIDLDKLHNPYKYKEQLLSQGFKESDNENVLTIKEKDFELSIDYVDYSFEYTKMYDNFSVSSVHRIDNYGVSCVTQNSLLLYDMLVFFTDDKGKVDFGRAYDGCTGRYLNPSKFKNFDVKTAVKDYNDLLNMYAYKGE